MEIALKIGLTLVFVVLMIRLANREDRRSADLPPRGPGFRALLAVARAIRWLVFTFVSEAVWQAMGAAIRSIPRLVKQVFDQA